MKVAALSGFKMALQMGLAKAVSGTHTVVHSNFLCSMPRVNVHMSRRDCVCVAQARATSWKPSVKPQLLILKLFTLVLASKHADSSIHMDYICAYR